MIIEGTEQLSDTNTYDLLVERVKPQTTTKTYDSEAWAHRKPEEDLLDIFRKIAYGLFWVPGGPTVF